MSFNTLGLALRASSKSKPFAAAANVAAATTGTASANTNTTTTNATTIRAFHSPFTVLGPVSPLATPTTKDISAQYEKQYYEHPHEPVMSHTGYRTYVVSEPDASARHYRVPAGAYPTSSPFIQFQATAPPEGVVESKREYSSTGAELLAHGFTTRAARRHKGGVGESAAVRYRSAPGEMGARGGGYGGQGLVDAKGTVEGVGELGERNPQPDGSAAEKFSKAGVEGAWKLRM